jgi:hypothetical protein
MGIILRQNKGSELTFGEVDGNFQSLYYSSSLNDSVLSFFFPSSSLTHSVDIKNAGGVDQIIAGANVTISPADGKGIVTINSVGGGGGGGGIFVQTGSFYATTNDLQVTGSFNVSDDLVVGGVVDNTDTTFKTVMYDTTTGKFHRTGSYGGGGGEETYSNSTPTPINFPSDADPNIAAGSTFTNQTLTQMMDQMLYPTLFPSLSNPSLQSVNLSPNGFQIIGKSITAGNLTLSCTLNQGSINPQYTTTTNKRSGLPNTYNYGSPSSAFVTSVSTTALSNTVANTATYTVLSGTNSFQVSVNYDIGPQPKDSIGGDFNSPLAAGNNPPGATSKTMTGVFPVFATQTNYNVTDQLPLQNMGSNDVIVDMILEDGTAGNKQAISIPNTAGGQAGFTAFTNVQQEDPLNAGQFVPITGGLTTFTLTTETKTIESFSRTYNLYTHNGGQIGARKLKFIN